MGNDLILGGGSILVLLLAVGGLLWVALRMTRCVEQTNQHMQALVDKVRLFQTAQQDPLTARIAASAARQPQAAVGNADTIAQLWKLKQTAEAAKQTQSQKNLPDDMKRPRGQLRRPLDDVKRGDVNARGTPVAFRDIGRPITPPGAPPHPDQL